MTQTRKWSLLAAVLAVAVFASGWFLLVSPKRGDAAALKTEAASAEQQNAQLVSQLNQLKAMSADLPKQQARLAAIRRQIPESPALPSLVRALTGATRDAGIDLISLTPSTPIALVAATPTVVPDSSEGSTTEGAATTEGATTSTAPVPAEELMQVPLTLEMKGGYVEVEQFIKKLEGLRRVFLVTGFTLQPEETTSDTSLQELTLSLTGRVFMVHKQAAATATSSTASGATSSVPTDAQ